MKRLLLSILGTYLGFSLSLALDDRNKTMDYLIQSRRNIETAYKMKAYEKSKYYYEKASTYDYASILLASRADMVGANVFAIKSFNSVMSLLSGKNELDTLTDSKEESILERLKYIRDNKGMNCAPEELGRAEAYYDLLVYEGSKENPDNLLIIQIRNKLLKDLKDAEDKVNLAMREGLLCYTGRPMEVEVSTEEKVVQLPVPPEKPELKPTETPLKVNARVHFDFDSYKIKKEYIPVLKEVVKAMKENPSIRLRIEGYTDDIGSKEYNDKLALKRAQAVKEFLIREGVDATRIEIRGVGKGNYIADNKTAIGRLINRRADFVVIELSSE